MLKSPFLTLVKYSREELYCIRPTKVTEMAMTIRGSWLSVLDFGRSEELSLKMLLLVSVISVIRGK